MEYERGNEVASVLCLCQTDKDLVINFTFLLHASYDKFTLMAN